MALSAVHLSSHAYLVCVTHALTTEREEVMGLLLGDIVSSPSPVGGGVMNKVAHIWGISVLSRSDKRKDRVEISPEQLAQVASTEAEELSAKLGRTARVIGWYHSHPHITVHPSHVDVQTQAMYQMLDSGFVGLIFSCFNTDEATKSCRVQVTAFQALPQGSSTLSSSSSAIEMSPVRRSEHKGLEVPIFIVPPPPEAPNLFEKLVALQRILLAEEKASYQESLKGSVPLHPLLQIHSASVYQKALCRVMEYSVLPLLNALGNQDARNARKLEELQEEKRQLQQQLKNKRSKRG